MSIVAMTCNKLSASPTGNSAKLFSYAKILEKLGYDIVLVTKLQDDEQSLILDKHLVRHRLKRIEHITIGDGVVNDLVEVADRYNCKLFLFWNAEDSLLYVNEPKLRNKINVVAILGEDVLNSKMNMKKHIKNILKNSVWFSGVMFNNSESYNVAVNTFGMRDNFFVIPNDNDKWKNLMWYWLEDNCDAYNELPGIISIEVDESCELFNASNECAALHADIEMDMALGSSELYLLPPEHEVYTDFEMQGIYCVKGEITSCNDTRIKVRFILNEEMLKLGRGKSYRIALTSKCSTQIYKL